MTFLRLLPVILSFILIAAHFKRADQFAIAIICLFIPALLLVKKLWVVRIVQTCLIVAALEWIRIMIHLVQIRIENEMDWFRLAAILGVVALFTFCSGFVFAHKEIKNIYS